MLRVLLSFLLLTSGPSAKEWKVATQIVEQRGSNWTENFRSLDADPLECEAIVFPEILRYKRFVDRVQTSVLLGAYLNEGSEKANYSIGIFQMKPSFAEQIEKAWMQSPFCEKYGIYFDITERKESRHKRMRRLQDEDWQCLYVAVFVRLMLSREPSLLEMSPEHRVAYLATAYNYSFTASLEKLERRMRQKTFHLDFVPLKNTKFYNYSQLAVKRFKQIRK